MIRRLNFLIILVTLLILLSVLAHAAISLGTVSSAFTVATNPLTLSHDNSTNDFLISGGVIESSSGKTIDSATYNSVSMTELGTGITQDRIHDASVFYLTSPSSGTNTVSMPTTGTSNDDMVWAVSFDGVDQSSPIGATQNVQGAAQSPSTSITTTVANSYLIAFVSWEDSGTVTENSGAGWVLQANGSSGTQLRGQIYTLSSPTVGSYPISLSTSDVQDYVIRIVEIKPAAGAPAAKRRVILQ